MKAQIKVTLKTGVLDPQGKAIQHALSALGFDGVRDVRQGKLIEVELTQSDPEAAREEVDRMCRDLLTNMVIEDFEFEIQGLGSEDLGSEDLGSEDHKSKAVKTQAAE